MKRNESQGITPAVLSALARGDLGNALTAATPGGIEAQEKAGQTTFVYSETLPKEMHGCTREQLEAIGFKFGADQDELFVKATLPAGWKKQATDHSMHSVLLDDKGRKRGSIFYKAAFYDRKADLSISRRYGVNGYIGVDKDGITVEDGSHTHYRVIVTDCGRQLEPVGVYGRSDYAAGDAMHKKAGAWLDQHFPNWRDPFAYWD